MAPAVMVAGAAVTAYGQYKQGEAAKNAADMTAEQARMNAKSSMAEGIRAAHEIHRQKRVAKSDARAAMAASGGVTDDISAIKTISDIDRIYNYNALAALFAAKTQADDQNYAAEMERYNGKQVRDASRLAMVGTMLSGASSAYSMNHTADPATSGSAATLSPIHVSAQRRGV